MRKARLQIPLTVSHFVPLGSSSQRYTPAAFIYGLYPLNYGFQPSHLLLLAPYPS